MIVLVIPAIAWMTLENALLVMNLPGKAAVIFHLWEKMSYMSQHIWTRAPPVLPPKRSSISTSSECKRFSAFDASSSTAIPGSGGSCKRKRHVARRNCQSTNATAHRAVYVSERTEHRHAQHRPHSAQTRGPKEETTFAAHVRNRLHRTLGGQKYSLQCQ